MKSFRVRPVSKIRGTVLVPGDKSISHRAAVLAAIADGPSTLRNYLMAEDCLNTLNCLRELGVSWDKQDGDVIIQGVGLHGLRAPTQDLYVGNSGTSIRLLLGLLAAQPFQSCITGDASICRRPMGRVMEPLRRMGADIHSESGDEFAPLRVRGSVLKPIRYVLPVPSAQVKSAILLAGLYAEGETVVVQELPSRDHTERMFEWLGLPVKVNGLTVRIAGNVSFRGREMSIPRDSSSAAFFVALGLLHPDAEIHLPGILSNPLRLGFLEVLQKAGVLIRENNPVEMTGESVVDIHVSSARIKAMDVGPDVIPRLIDEIPILAVMASLCSGTTRIRGAMELRVKESDRIAAIVDMLTVFGVKVMERVDGMEIIGGKALRGGMIHSHGDHRIAMSAVIGGVLASGETVVRDVDCIATSYPDFLGTIRHLCGEDVIEEIAE